MTNTNSCDEITTFHSSMQQKGRRKHWISRKYG